MLNARFTDSARKAIREAIREAEFRDSDQLGALHIFATVLNAEPAVFHGAPVDFEQMRAAADEILATVPSAGAQRAIENALRLADEWSSPACGLRHLVIGILTEPDESVTALVDRMKVSIDVVRNWAIANRCRG